jgi:hypothetical protein
MKRNNRELESQDSLVLSPRHFSANISLAILVASGPSIQIPDRSSCCSEGSWLWKEVMNPAVLGGI